LRQVTKEGEENSPSLQMQELACRPRIKVQPRLVTSQATNEVIASLTFADSAQSVRTRQYSSIKLLVSELLRFQKGSAYGLFSGWYEPYDFAGRLAGRIQADSAETGT